MCKYYVGRIIAPGSRRYTLKISVGLLMAKVLPKILLAGYFLSPVCISRDSLGLSCNHGLLSKVSWHSLPGDRSLHRWMLLLGVVTSSAFGSDFSTDDSQIVPPLK